MKYQNINEGIRDQVVQLVMEDGVMRGQVPTYIALQLAVEKELDLVQVSPSVDNKPPICKLLDYGKIKYKESKGKKNHHKIVTKEMKFGFNISEHDMETKIKQIQKFISKKYHVRFILELRGRYRYMRDLAREKMNDHLKALETFAQWEEVSESNNNIYVTLKQIEK